MNTNTRKYDFFQTGCWYDIEKEKMLIKDPEAMLQIKNHFTEQLELIANSQTIKQNIKVLKNIVALCASSIRLN